jgi:hypothetical protein
VARGRDEGGDGDIRIHTKAAAASGIGGETKAKNGWEFGIQRGERLSMEEGGVALKGLLRDSLRQLLELKTVEQAVIVARPCNQVGHVYKLVDFPLSLKALGDPEALDWLLPAYWADVGGRGASLNTEFL